MLRVLEASDEKNYDDMPELIYETDDDNLPDLVSDIEERDSDEESENELDSTLQFVQLLPLSRIPTLSGISSWRTLIAILSSDLLIGVDSDDVLPSDRETNNDRKCDNEESI